MGRLNKLNLYILIPIILSILLFSPFIFAFFVQDDFFFLAISKANTFKEFFQFFIPRTDVVWYRPLSSQVFFFLGRRLFGLDPFYYHLVVLITHLINIILIYCLAFDIFKSRYIATLSSFIYGLSSVHFIALFWLSTYSFVLGPTFVLLTLLLYMKNKYYLSFVSFFLGLLTSEVVLLTVVPISILIYYKQKSLGKLMIKLVPYLITTFLLIYFRKIIFPSHISGPYSFILNTSFIFLFKFYLFRLLGIPMLIDILDTQTKLIVIIPALIISMLGLFTLYKTLYNIKLQKKENREDYVKKIIFLIFVFLSFIFPFLLLPNHYSPHYLTYSLIAISILASFIFSYAPKLLAASFIICFVFLQFMSISITYGSHWIVKRAQIAERLINQNNFLHPVGSEEYYSLGANQEAAVYNNP